MFREDKTTQMAASFLNLANGRMPYLLLMKMLYIADKKMLLKWGKPITYDLWYSMKYGPVLSHTLDLIRRKADGEYWPAYIETADNFEVVLHSDPGTDALSRAEDQIISETFAEWGHLDAFTAADLTHEFPEYTDPGNGAIPIAYHEVLKLGGVSGEEISDILENIAGQDTMRLFAGSC
jgi:hypothetical protein